MLQLRDIMTTDVVTVSPELTLRAAMDVLATRHVSGAPVVTGKKVVGVVSLTDLAAFAAEMPGVPTERPQALDLADFEGDDATIEWVEGEEPPSTFFLDQWADAGADVAERIAEPGGPEWNALEEHIVAEVMTRKVLKLPPGTRVDSAADFMREAAVHRVLVMTGDELVGLVTTRDIANAVADHKLVKRTYVFGPD